MSLGFSLVIPTRDGAPHSLTIAKEYRRLGIAFRYFVDGRSSPQYIQDVMREVETATKLPISSSASYVEEILPELADISGARRIFRLDDDEFPSRALLIWLNDVAALTDKTVIAAPRRAVAVRDATAVCAEHIPNLGPLDVQCRGFRVDSVKFTREIHTPGFAVNEADILYAPSDCPIYHFDWVVRSRNERARKLDFYETVKPGSYKAFKYQYLYEDFDPAHYEFSLLHDADISALALRLHDERTMHAKIAPGSKWLFRRTVYR